jgi:hypothetical protein
MSTEAPKSNELDRFIDEDRMKADVSINASDLDSAMMEHASLYVHYASNTVRARRQYERIKSGVEILEAKLDMHYRETLAAEGKKVTEAMITTAIKNDPRWSQAQARELDAQAIWKMCEVAESALVQRKDLILEIARDRRKEREGQLRVLEQQEFTQTREQAAAASRDNVVNELKKRGETQA